MRLMKAPSQPFVLRARRQTASRVDWRRKRESTMGGGSGLGRRSATTTTMGRTTGDGNDEN
jgi:hypothetical protein